MGRALLLFLGLLALSSSTFAFEELEASDDRSSTAPPTPPVESTTHKETTENPTKASTAPPHSETTTSDNADTGTPEVQSTTPAAPPTTAPVDLTTVKWSIPLDNTDPSALIILMNQLQTKVKGLQNKLQQISGEVTGDSTLVQRLNNAQLIVDDINNRFNDTEERLYDVNATYYAQQLSANSMEKTLTCFANSNCVTEAPTTILTTPFTGTTVEPTATPCVADQTADEENGSFEYNGSLTFNCTTQIVANISTSNVNLNLTVTISGTGTFVDVVDAVTLNQLANFNESGSQQIHGSTNMVNVIYNSIEATDSLDMIVTYATVDPCEDVDCGNGTCVVNPSTRQSVCNCDVCWSDNGDQHCSEKMNICDGRNPQRACLTQDPTSPNKCTTNDIDGTCSFKCECGTGYKQVNDQKCTKE